MVTTYCQLSDEGGDGGFFLLKINAISNVELFWLTTIGPGRLDWDLLIWSYRGRISKGRARRSASPKSFRKYGSELNVVPKATKAWFAFGMLWS